MKQVNLKSERLAELLEHLVSQTGETKVDAVTKALEARLQTLEAGGDAERTLAWLNSSIWAELGSNREAPSKQEQEDLLGF